MPLKAKSMKFFLIISLFSALLLSLQPPGKQPQAPKEILPYFVRVKSDFINTFSNAEVAHLAWAFLTGEKKGLSPKTQKDFQEMQLGFLFSPSGIHISFFIFMLFFLFKKTFSKNKKLLLQGLTFLLLLMVFPYPTLKRLIIFRIFLMIKNKFKFKINLDYLFLITYFISFIVGDYFVSPMSFIVSILFWGTFLSLRDYPRSIIVLGLLSSHLILCFFTGALVSPMALIFNFHRLLCNDNASSIFIYSEFQMHGLELA
jgi:predicted membrane metal-binding protein